MDKKKKKIINNYIMPIIGIGALIISFFLSSKVTFIPDVSVCSTGLNSLCEIPLLGKILGLLNTGILTFLIIYFIIILVSLFILNLLGFKYKDIDTSY